MVLVARNRWLTTASRQKKQPPFDSKLGPQRLRARGWAGSGLLPSHWVSVLRSPLDLERLSPRLTPQTRAHPRPDRRMLRPHTRPQDRSRPVPPDRRGSARHKPASPPEPFRQPLRRYRSVPQAFGLPRNHTQQPLRLRRIRRLIPRRPLTGPSRHRRLKLFRRRSLPRPGRRSCPLRQRSCPLRQRNSPSRPPRRLHRPALPLRRR